MKSKTGLVISNTDTVSYTKLNKLVSIENAKDIKLTMQAKALEINNEYTGLQFYLSDKEFNYYFGASSKEWNKIFCKINIQNEWGQTMNLEDFQVFESNDKNSEPLALCFVLDHSGSIDEEDAKTMQKSILTLVDTKSVNDAFSVIKFDNYAKREIGITTNNSTLRDQIKVVGTIGYGGGTALIDGIYEALNLLIENMTFKNKAIIVLTDGFENSSKRTQNLIFKKAIDNKIAVFTVGMGKTVDVPFLRSIATGTNGGYYWIEDNTKLPIVFADIYKNMKNFYTLRFNTPYPGTYKITLHLCNDKIKDSLVYFFNNFVPDLLYTTDQFETDSLFKEITGIGDTLYLEDFNTERVTETIEFKELQNDFKSLVFPNIKFDYNKTSIVPKTDNELVNVIDFMKNHQNCRIEIQGHTDNRGTPLFNEKLSQARAEAIKTMITVTGIASARIQTRGYGQTKPIAKNDNDEGRQINRRVEFILLKL